MDIDLELYRREVHISSQPLVRLLLNARGETLITCGHVPHKCHADKFNRLVIRFLTSLESDDPSR